MYNVPSVPFSLLGFGLLLFLAVVGALFTLVAIFSLTFGDIGDR